MKRFVVIAVVSIMLTSCSTEEVRIEFGKDQCGLCRMTIMDKKFGAALVNNKGKVVRFDSGECMVSYLQTEKLFKASRYLIINFNQPEQLIEADKAFYLKGGKVNSPMGGQLAAFKTHEEALAAKKQLEGDIILWNNLSGFKF